MISYLNNLDDRIEGWDWPRGEGHKKRSLLKSVRIPNKRQKASFLRIHYMSFISSVYTLSVVLMYYLKYPRYYHLVLHVYSMIHVVDRTQHQTGNFIRHPRGVYG